VYNSVRTDNIPIKITAARSALTRKTHATNECTGSNRGIRTVLYVQYIVALCCRDTFFIAEK
jgi:hypothetical protein